MQRALKLIACFVPPLRRMREKGALGNQMRNRGRKLEESACTGAEDAQHAYAQLRLRVKGRSCAFSCEIGGQARTLMARARVAGGTNGQGGTGERELCMCRAETRLLRKVHCCSSGCERDLRCIVAWG